MSRRQFLPAKIEKLECIWAEVQKGLKNSAEKSPRELKHDYCVDLLFETLCLCQTKANLLQKTVFPKTQHLMLLSSIKAVRGRMLLEDIDVPCSVNQMELQTSLRQNLCPHEYHRQDLRGGVTTFEKEGGLGANDPAPIL